MSQVKVRIFCDSTRSKMVDKNKLHNTLFIIVFSDTKRDLEIVKEILFTI